MAKEIESISTALFDKIRSRFGNITLGDENAKAVSDPSKARFFNFTYTDETGAEYGKITISLIDETSLKIYYGQNISTDMDRDQRHGWYDFLRNLRKFARRNLLNFDTRDISKSNLEIQDIKQQSKSDSVAVSGDISNSVTESRLYGTTRNSFIDMGECRLSIKHDGLVGEKLGDRSRKIREMFIETNKGERFLVPHKNLTGACALAQHVNQGGSVNDDFAQHINELVKEMSSLKHFVRTVKHRQFEDEDTSNMSTAAVNRYDDIKTALRQMRGARGHHAYLESFQASAPFEPDYNVDEMRERFVKKVYDDRFNDALPYVQRAYQNHQNSQIGEMGNELAEWMDSVYEDTWAKPDNDEKVRALQELLKTPIPVGIDGIDAQAKVEPIIGDDDLDNAIYELSKNGADTDARALIKDWLQQHMPGLLDQLQFGDKNADAITNYAQPVSPSMSNNEFGSERPPGNVGAAAQMTMEDDSSLDFIRTLAGLRK
jgi:hypothetical protein